MVSTRVIKLPTHRLLAYFKKHYRDRRGQMEHNCRSEHSSTTQEDLDNFMSEFNIIKVELDNREHVEK